MATEGKTKKIKLDKDYPVLKNDYENNDKQTSVKVESNISHNYLSVGDRSKDILLKVFPVLNVSDDTKSNQNPFQLIVTNLSNLCSKDDNIQVNNSCSTKTNQDNKSHIRPSEALFVRCLLPHCKRLAPLWFKGVSSMREKNREEHRRISASTTNQTQNDWETISYLISEMNESTETETVVNLLKKLYKELPADSVLWFIKCWLRFPETLENEEKCSFSRGDARGRMRRIDGGKGSDKVWRLDTIVGMLFHGMPMSSTDTNIMVHTCNEELCIRPQHLRFRASSVALVAVLKALQQTGYLIIPPSDDTYLINGKSISPNDEFVDVSGPFKIEQLQKYRLEELKPYEHSMGKLNPSSSDNNLLEKYPILKNYYPSYGAGLDKTMRDYKARRKTSANSIRTVNDIKRSAQTTSNSTGSPPQISDGNSHQCHSPPNLTNVKSLNIEIAPTPRKVELSNSLRICSFKKSDDSLSSSIFSNSRERESFGQAPDLLAEEPYDIKPPISVEVLSSVSRVTNESPIISGSTNGSGKNTPRQPAKKRLEARTPAILPDDEQDTFSTVSSPLDSKFGTSNSSISAFRVVSKKNVIRSDLKPSDELLEVEVAKILDPCSTFQNGNYNPNDSCFAKSYDANEKVLSINNISDLDSGGNISSKNKVSESLTTPSPFDYLFMAISQNPNLSVINDQKHVIGNGSCSPTMDDCNTPLISNDSIMSCQMPSKSSSKCCRFTPEQASLLLNVIRNSPYNNNNPEIIDMLFNMMQQYPCMGDGINGRPDSRVLRRQIYQQLSKASPQLDSCSHTPILNEISNDESISQTLYQNPLNKVIFNPPSSIPKNKIFSMEN